MWSAAPPDGPPDGLPWACANEWEGRCKGGSTFLGTPPASHTPTTHFTPRLFIVRAQFTAGAVESTVGAQEDSNATCYVPLQLGVTAFELKETR